MPTYEYRCKSCGDELEVVQAFTDDALTVHEACGGELRKVFGSVGISFKGSGFYKNDSRGSSSSTKTSESDSSSSSTSSDSPSDTKTTDAKPADATKADTKAGSKADSKNKKKAAPAAASS